MLQKLRSRHAIDVPADGFGTRRPTLLLLGGLVLLFVLAPLLGALLGGARDGGRDAILAIGAGIGALALVLLVVSLRGKPGWRR